MFGCDADDVAGVEGGGGVRDEVGGGGCEVLRGQGVSVED